MKTVPLNIMHHILFEQRACTHWVAFIKEGGVGEGGENNRL